MFQHSLGTIENKFFRGHQFGQPLERRIVPIAPASAKKVFAPNRFFQPVFYVIGAVEYVVDNPRFGWRRIWIDSVGGVHKYHVLGAGRPHHIDK